MVGKLARNLGDFCERHGTPQANKDYISLVFATEWWSLDRNLLDFIRAKSHPVACRRASPAAHAICDVPRGFQRAVVLQISDDVPR